MVLTEVENFSSKENFKCNLNSSIFRLGSCICFPGYHMTCPRTWCLQAAETGHLIDWGCGVSHSDASRLFLVQAPGSGRPQRFLVSSCCVVTSTSHLFKPSCHCYVSWPAHRFPIAPPVIGFTSQPNPLLPHLN